MTKIIIGTFEGGHSTTAKGVVKYLYKKYNNPKLEIVTNKRDFHNYTLRTYRVPPLRGTTEKGLRILGTLKNFFYSLKILLRSNPDIIFCCGANNSIFLGIIGKFLGKKVVAVENFTRIESMSKSVRILSHFCDEIWIRHLVGKKWVEKAEYVGSLHPYKDKFEELNNENKKIPILIVPSSGDVPDKLPISDEYILTGLSQDKFLEKLGKTETIITRGGMAAWEAAQLASNVIVIPHKQASEKQQDKFAKYLESNFENVEIRKGFIRQIKKEKRLESESGDWL